MQTPGLGHIVLTVSDIDRSRIFYGDLLGFEVQDINYKSGTMLLGFSFTVGGVSFWIVNHDQTPANDAFSEFRIGLDHLGFKATNEAELQAMADKLLQAGVNTKGMETFPTGNKYVTFRDPDNIQLEYWLD
jgi:catechol 2,3-dioxygenase-like lactoylglutathione lyase family enzyme